MKKLFLSLLSLFVTGSALAQPVHKVHFNEQYEMSGQKIALHNINPSLPRNWDGYNYVVLEYRISTAQRFQVGFTTDWGYNELRVMCYVPGAWNRIAIPLVYYTQLPPSAYDVAATMNHARYTGWINLGGKRGPMHGVDSIGFRMRKAIGNPSLEIRNVYLSRTDPGDLYMGDKPAVDEFGQSNLVDYPAKVHSLDELKAQWTAEDSEPADASKFNYSKYGGYKDKKVKGTGFFRTQKVGGRWWFVDPEGYLFLSVGVDCVSPGGSGSIRDYNFRPNMYKAIPPYEVKQIIGGGDSRRGYTEGHFGQWNLYRRYGKDYQKKAIDNVIKRMTRWGVNTIANWSSPDVKRTDKKAYLEQLSDLGLDATIMGMADVYDPNFASNIERVVAQHVEPLKNDPWLVGYFLGNEPSWINSEVRLTGIIEQGPDRPIKTALKQYLQSKGDTPKNRRAFILESYEKFLNIVNDALKRHDPNHLNLGMRFADPLTLPDEIINMCKMFDVFSFNCYMLKPSNAMFEKVRTTIDRPIIIGEYHFGTVDRGYAQSLWQVDNQQQRGVAYRYYTENAYAHPSLVGTGYFQWNDQDLTGRFDGENYNCGLVDVTDRPYKEQTDAMIETAKRLYKVHSGKLKPFNQEPENCRGHELVPDLWNK